MGPPASCRISRVRHYSGSCQLPTASLTGLSPSLAVLPITFCSQSSCFPQSATPLIFLLMVWPLSFSLTTTRKIDFSFSSSAYLDVSVQRVPSACLWIQHTVPASSAGGFPHSDIPGSRDICSSPGLFAAYHVFHRLSVPRHPPCALSCLTGSGFGLFLRVPSARMYSVTSPVFGSSFFGCSSQPLGCLSLV